MDTGNPIRKYNYVPPILLSEVPKAMHSQKLERAPGPDNIPNKLLRDTANELNPILTTCLDWEEYGLNINGSRLNHLRFADDLILIEEDPNKLQAIVQKLAIKSKELGLEINKSKTKLITNSIEVEIKLDEKKSRMS
ncbi:Putative uncharacterized transposon-derived protein F52C9.6 [Eumeta japonica]|uniref:Uncharacterized transposon-derived protein F52C9.6 n=1 Tax=Eumeta variegata TaxID=151549 RepID=A0A4C1TUM6_EUMVA|nr:Putative uncharacterized transposon-derived protein F52C9.6 [Eumeta japonica]